MAQIKISNKYLDNIEWLAGSAFPYHPGNEMDIWKISVPANLDFIDNFLKVLSLAEIARASKYVRNGDRNRSVISRGALRMILAKYLDEQAQAISFAEGLNKKPYLDSETGLFFNVSHSGDWVIIAVANSEIGVDIEFINPDFKYQDILTDYFIEEEVAFIQQNLSVERFYMLWTRKEALSKATGTGLDSNLKHFPGLDGLHLADPSVSGLDEDWSINSFNISENYIASIAHHPYIKEFGFWDFIIDL